MFGDKILLVKCHLKEMELIAFHAWNEGASKALKHQSSSSLMKVGINAENGDFYGINS